MTDQQQREEPGFRVEDRMYPVPPIDTFTFGELETLYDYTGLTIYDWGRRLMDEGSERWSRATSAPSFNACLVHVAYQRGNPDTPADTVRDLVRDLHWLDVIAGLMTAEDDDLGEASGTMSVPGPSSETRPNENESTKTPSQPSSGESSSTDTTPTDGHRVELAAVTIGIGGSDTSPMSDRKAATG